VTKLGVQKASIKQESFGLVKGCNNTGEKQGNTGNQIKEGHPWPFVKTQEVTPDSTQDKRNTSTKNLAEG